MNKKVTIIILLFIILCLIGTIFSNYENDVIISNNIVENSEYSISGNENYIFVHIEGAVENPGIKKVILGTRLYELLELSGGESKEADLSKINLASILKDEQKIFIPYKQEEIDNFTSNNTNDSKKLVNINTATKSELLLLPGVGEKMANKIITYRNENGFFNSTDELKNVSGIGESKFNKIQDLITI